ncbi:serine/threonine protein kinase, CMGC [Dimargaris xerosporica]|nr:serine/threonine protein kinase, CMGC [Dimargaris xerosporica]
MPDYSPASDSHETDDYEDTSGSEEDISDYCKGGYHPIKLHDRFKDGRYVVVRKLGWGHFSTVWLALDTHRDRHVALKVVKSAKNYTEAALDEIKLCDKVVQANPKALGHQHVVQMLDHFKHQGPHGTHVCMVFEVLGENLLSLIRRYRKRGGLPVPLVKDVTRQIAQGLDYMHHDCQMIHTDLKPENVLVCIANVETMIREQAKAANTTPLDTALPSADDRDATTYKAQTTPMMSTTNGTSFGAAPSAASISTHSTTPASPGLPALVGTASTTAPRVESQSLERTMSDISLAEPQQQKTPPPSARATTTAQPTNSSSPNFALAKDSVPTIALEQPTEPSLPKDSPTNDHEHSQTIVEAWDGIRVKIADLGNACWVDKHFTEDIQTRQYRSPEVTLGIRWGPTADVWSLACMVFELLTGDFLFQPRSGRRYTKDDDHLALMVETVGPFPRHLALSGKYSRDFFNRRGQLRYISRLEHWSIASRLQEEYYWDKEDAEQVQAFLLPMLNLNPAKRVSARTVLEHPWLAS